MDRGQYFISTTPRAGTITEASILLGFIGIIGLIGATIFLFIVWFPGETWESGNLFTLIGVITFIFSVLRIKAAHLLWQSKKSGGILGIILCAIGIFPLDLGLLSICMMPIIDTTLIILIFIGVDILTIILIVMGWKSLK